MKKALIISRKWGGIHYLPNFLRLKQHYKIYTISLLVGLLILILLWPTQPALTITDGKTKQTVFIHPLDILETFSLRFIHSVHKTPVIEQYYIDAQLNIILDGVVYESYGVGNPSSVQPDENFRQEDGKYIIGNINRTLPYFDQSIGQVIANHQLIINNKTISLSTLSSPGNWVRFQVKKVSIIRFLKEGAIYGR